MENRVHFVLFISLASVDTAATQGTYSRMNTSIEKADRGVNPVMAAATWAPVAVSGKAVEHGQGADHHLLGDQAGEQSHRRLPEAEAQGLENGGDDAAQGTQHAVRLVLHHMQGEVKGLEQPEQDAHQQDQGARLDEEALHLLPHMGEHVVQGGQAVRGQLQHKGGGLPGEEGMLEQQAGQDARRHADDIQAEDHQPGPGSKESRGEQPVHRQLGGAAHKGHQQDGHPPVLLILHGPGTHDGGHRAAEAHEHGDERLPAQAEAPQQAGP